MKPRAHDARRLDVAALAADAATLQGQWPLASFGRLCDQVPPDQPLQTDPAVPWSARGEVRRPSALQPEIWLHVQAQADVWLQCQRCLTPMPVALEVDRSFRFVRGEDEAARLDAESEDDVLELAASLDLHALIEDELVLALPIVPRHDNCSSPSHEPTAPEPQDKAGNPFAALAALKRKPPVR